MVRRLFLTVMALLLIVPTIAAANGQWLALDLGTLDDIRPEAWANDINDRGIIVGGGYGSNPNLIRPIVASPEDDYALQELPLPPGSVAAEATAINNLGDVLLWGARANGTIRAYWLNIAGTFGDLGTLD